VVEEVNARERIGRFRVRDEWRSVEAERLGVARVEAEEVAAIATQKKPWPVPAAEVKYAVTCAFDRDGR